MTNGNELKTLLLTKDDLRIIGEYTKRVMVPKSIDGLIIDTYKHVVAIRMLYDSYKVQPPFDIYVSPYPDGLLK